MTSTDLQRRIEALWRIESPRLIAVLARMLRDVGVAEELAQDALVAAMESWPQTGVPDNPAAWLTTTAKRRAIDHLHSWATNGSPNRSSARPTSRMPWMTRSATTCCA